jgi:hypothetical protein
MKGNKRKKAFISFYLFFRIGTFQWVTADSNKKTLVLFRLRDVLSARLAQTSFPILFRPPPPLKSDRQKHITRASVFAKQLPTLIALAVGNRNSAYCGGGRRARSVMAGACPGYPRVSAQRATARGGEVKKSVASEAIATTQRRCLDSSLRRRGVDGRDKPWDKPGQDGRGSETSRKQPANS